MQRIQELKNWLKEDVGLKSFDLKPASSDASFRRYFRVTPDEALKDGFQTYIVMDAPPEQEDTGPFITVSNLLSDINLNVPLVKQTNIEQGFLLLSDLGSTQYLDELNESTVDRLYGDALDALYIMQTQAPRRSNDLPDYDHALLMQEMELFREWYLKKHLGITLPEALDESLTNIFEALAQNALNQPQVCVHRDYHSRNLMITPDNNPGILDFQDAVIGPVTYDLVSLLRDCYVSWPRERVEEWAIVYLNKVTEAGLIDKVDKGTLLKWFDWMGVQRHLKASGIFARLNYRDNKPGYLKDIPRTLGYGKRAV